MLRHALAYARRGLFIFPCRPCDKIPATEHGCLDATTDPTLIEEWWSRNPDYNIAIATGAHSGAFILDVDGDGGEHSLRHLEERHGPLPPTVEVITGKGRHVYFDWPGRTVRNSAGKIGSGLDIRGDGGYGVAPPSVHPSGRPYAFSVDSAKTLAPAPAWLLDRLAPNGNGHRDATRPSVWRDLVCNGVAEGQRNDTLARLAGYLFRRRLDAVVVLNLLSSWNQTHCRPPLDESELTAVVDSIALRELRRRGLR